MPGKFRLETAPASGPQYFELIGSDGTQRWSSKDKLFRTTDVIIGSQSFSARTTPIDTVTPRTVGSCNANATFVHGYMSLASVSLGVGQLSPFPAVGDWYDAGGSYVGFPSVSSAGRNDDMIVLTFSASGGVVTLEERLICYEIGNAGGQTFSFPAYTVAYELWVTTFA